MRTETTSFSGRCHCGNLGVTFETRLRPEQLPVRACTCSFCRTHGARYTSDPAGRVHITVRDPGRVNRYRFALKTADFLICRECGVYLGAVLTAGGSSYATININTLDAAQVLTQASASVTYDGETATERRARRMANWTPVVEIKEG